MLSEFHAQVACERITRERLDEFLKQHLGPKEEIYEWLHSEICRLIQQVTPQRRDRYLVQILIGLTIATRRLDHLAEVERTLMAVETGGLDRDFCIRMAVSGLAEAKFFQEARNLAARILSHRDRGFAFAELYAVSGYPEDLEAARNCRESAHDDYDSNQVEKAILQARVWRGDLAACHEMATEKNPDEELLPRVVSMLAAAGDIDKARSLTYTIHDQIRRAKCLVALYAVTKNLADADSAKAAAKASASPDNKMHQGWIPRILIDINRHRSDHQEARRYARMLDPHGRAEAFTRIFAVGHEVSDLMAAREAIARLKPFQRAEYSAALYLESLDVNDLRRGQKGVQQETAPLWRAYGAVALLLAIRGRRLESIKAKFLRWGERHDSQQNERTETA